MKTDWEGELESLLTDPVLWDEGVEAARNACVAGAPLAAAAITAAAWYDNPLNGGRALLRAKARFAALPLELPAWVAGLQPAPHAETGDPDFVAGFGFVAEPAAETLVRGAQRLCSLLPSGRLAFYLECRQPITRATGAALNVAGLCALVFADAGLDADEAERRYLLLRLGTALSAAQRARRAGLAHFPFFDDGYRYEGPWPQTADAAPCTDETLRRLKQEVGLE